MHSLSIVCSLRVEWVLQGSEINDEYYYYLNSVTKLFAIYVDDLTLSLIKSKIGCMLDEVCFNHIFNADDLCLLAPCVIALQKLLDICHDYGVEHDVIYYPLKSVCIVLKPDRFSLKCPLVHFK